MKSFFRGLTPLAAVIAFLTLLAATSHAQAPDPQYDSKYVTARQLEPIQPEKAFDEYAAVKNKEKDPEIQADAMLRAALFAESLNFGKSEDTHADGEQRAHTNYKDLVLHFANTRAGKYTKDKYLQEKIEQKIDKRNSKIASYKVVDTLVRLTGSIPAFSYWFALFLIAVIVKAATLPLTLKMYKSQKEMQILQPLIKQMQARHEGDKVKQQEEMMKLYKEHKVNPMASCFPMLIQLPFMIWIYNTIRLYEFHFVNGKFLWIGSSLAGKYPDTVGGSLAQFDFALLVIYAVTNYITMRMTPATDPQAAQTQKMSAVMVTFMMFYFCMTSRWSSAFIFYWLILNIFSALQSYYFIYRPAKMAPLTGTLLPATASVGVSSPPPLRQQPKRKK